MFVSEEDAFYCLAVLVEDVLAGYYSLDMMATQVRGQSGLWQHVWTLLPPTHNISNQGRMIT
jgi:hypothetical protein